MQTPHVPCSPTPKPYPRRRQAFSAGSRALVCLLSLLLALLAGLPAAQAQVPLTVAVGKTDGTQFPNVLAYVTVVDASGRPVLGLGPGQWDLSEDGKPVKELVQVDTTVNTQEPLFVVLVIDTSGSMQGRAIEDAKAAATTFAQGLGAKDKAAVVAFADKPVLVQAFTDRKEDLAKAIGGLKAVGETAFNDALLLSAQVIGQQQSGRRIVVVLSDGEDTASKAKLEEATAGVQAAGAPVFTVGLGQNADRKVLGGLATDTGGVALYAPSSADLRATYANIADQLRNQYVLTFRSGLTADNARHQLLVRARSGNAQAEAKAVFLATSTPPEITVVSPQPNQLVRGVVKVEIQVKAAGPVRKVEATAAGRVVGTLDKEPFTLNWDTSQLAGGNHLLDITVHDTLGNRATKQVSVRVEAVALLAATPTPRPTPAPAPVRASAFGDQEVVLAGGGIFAALSLALVAVRRARRSQVPPAWERMPKDKPLAKCPECGRALKRGRECPDCLAKDQELVRQRLRELGEGGEEEPGAGEGPR